MACALSGNSTSTAPRRGATPKKTRCNTSARSRRVTVKRANLIEAMALLFEYVDPSQRLRDLRSPSLVCNPSLPRCDEPSSFKIGRTQAAFDFNSSRKSYLSFIALPHTAQARGLPHRTNVQPVRGLSVCLIRVGRLVDHPVGWCPAPPVEAVKRWRQSLPRNRPTATEWEVLREA